MSAEDYCELCDLPKSQCIHGNPPTPPPPPAPRASALRAGPVVRKRTAPPAAAAARTVPRRWTPPEAFGESIVEVLEEHGGQMEQEELFAALELRMQERLTAADHESTPEGELRWRYAARRARQALIAEGRMTKGRPGVWSLG